MIRESIIRSDITSELESLRVQRFEKCRRCVAIPTIIALEMRSIRTDGSCFQWQAILFNEAARNLKYLS